MKVSAAAASRSSKTRGVGILHPAFLNALLARLLDETKGLLSYLDYLDCRLEAAVPRHLQWYDDLT